MKLKTNQEVCQRRVEEMKVVFCRDDSGEIKSFQIHSEGVKVEFNVPGDCKFDELKMRECYGDGSDCNIIITEHDSIEIKPPVTLKECVSKFIDFKVEQESSSMGIAERARHNLELGEKFPYDGKRESVSPDWAHKAARGVMIDLCDRRYVKHALVDLDDDVKRDIILSIKETILTAHEGAV